MNENIALLIFCGTPVGIIVALGFAIRYLRRQLTAVRAENEILVTSRIENQQRLEAARAETAVATADATAALRLQWLATLPSLSYRNEVEVESKLIVPLLHHLGYTADQWQQRVKVEVPVGRQRHTGEADFVVHDNSGRVALIVEAKAPGAAIDDDVQAQARSYAYALNAPKYLLTNGRLLQLWQRGIETDTIIIESTVADLAAVWEELAQ